MGWEVSRGRNNLDKYGLLSRSSSMVQAMKTSWVRKTQFCFGIWVFILNLCSNAPNTVLRFYWYPAINPNLIETELCIFVLDIVPFFGYVH